MNQDSYNSNSLGFEQPQPPQSPVNHPIFNAHNDPLISQTTLNEQMTQLTSMCEIFCQFVQQKQEEKRIEEEQAAKAQTWKLSDDDDEEESSNSLNDNISELPPFSAITPDEPVLSTEEPDNSLSMGDEHLDTISVTESDEFIKSGVETLIIIPKVDAFLAVEDEFTSSQCPKSDLYPEGDMLLFEEFLNDDHSSDVQTKSSSTSLNYLLEETHTFDNSLPEFTTLSKEEIRLTKRLLYDNSSPRPPKEFVSDNSDAKIKSFSPSPILIKDSDSHMEEIDLSLNP
nr:hypothetical protein [Tanacetum cinerariifolium]